MAEGRCRRGRVGDAPEAATGGPCTRRGPIHDIVIGRNNWRCRCFPNALRRGCESSAGPRKPLKYKNMTSTNGEGLCLAEGAAGRRGRIRIDKITLDNDSYRAQNGTACGLLQPPEHRRNQLIPKGLFGGNRPAGAPRPARALHCAARAQRRRLPAPRSVADRAPGRPPTFASPAPGAPSWSRLLRRSPGPPRASRTPLAAARTEKKCRCRPNPCPRRMLPRRTPPDRSVA